MEAGAEKVLALCPCCEFQLRVSADKKKMPIEVVDLARFAASALGYDFPDPNPEVQRQWAVFEAMIALMTPQGFANLMGTMWPELIDAMPFGMGPMMRMMGKIPGALEPDEADVPGPLPAAAADDDEKLPAAERSSRRHGIRRIRTSIPFSPFSRGCSLDMSVSVVW